jgi:predicted dehydrogenase
MEAFHYRYHPVFRRVLEICGSGELGEIREIDAAFHVPVRDPADIRMSYDTGGGVTMDIGCYPISLVRHISGEEPATVEAKAEVGPPDVDVRLTATLTFPGGISATISGDMRAEARLAAHLSVTGSLGSLRVLNPLVPQMGHQLRIACGSTERVETLDRRPSYAYQLDAFLDGVEHGTPLPTDADDAVRQMRVIDRCYQAAGLPLRGQVR